MTRTQLCSTLISLGATSDQAEKYVTELDEMYDMMQEGVSISGDTVDGLEMAILRDGTLYALTLK